MFCEGEEVLEGGIGLRGQLNRYRKGHGICYVRHKTTQAPKKRVKKEQKLEKKLRASLDSVKGPRLGRIHALPDRAHRW